jgi:multiple antibiotic resistance protein
MQLDFLIAALVTLVVVMDPLSLVPAYLALTHRFSAVEARNVAARASVIAGAVLIAFALIGNWVLKQLEIGLPAFRIAGGLLLFAIAFEMVYGARTPRETTEAEQAVQEDRIRQVAAYPLAIPLMAGPGAITATLLLAGRATGEPANLGILIGVIVVATAICAVVFLLATPIKRLLGTTGNTVLSRLLGIVLAALAVQFVIDGVRAVLPLSG